MLKVKNFCVIFLREEWGFDGFVVSDCGAIGNLTSRKHYTAKNKIESLLIKFWLQVLLQIVVILIMIKK